MAERVHVYDKAYTEKGTDVVQAYIQPSSTVLNVSPKPEDVIKRRL